MPVGADRRVRGRSAARNHGSGSATRSNQILTIAASLFVLKGFEGTTMRDIAAAVGILPGSLYHHFASKEQLLHEIMRPFIRRAVGLYREIVHRKETPAATLRVFEACAQKVPVDRLAGHFHDTWGMAIANIHAALGFGIATFDASVAGLGGCPYSPGASGNVATEDVVYLLDGLGVETGVDLDALVDCAAWISGVLGRAPQSRVARARLAQRSREEQRT